MFTTRREGNEKRSSIWKQSRNDSIYVSLLNVIKCFILKILIMILSLLIERVLLSFLLENRVLTFKTRTPSNGGFWLEMLSSSHYYSCNFKFLLVHIKSVFFNLPLLLSIHPIWTEEKTDWKKLDNSHVIGFTKLVLVMIGREDSAWAQFWKKKSLVNILFLFVLFGLQKKQK